MIQKELKQVGPIRPERDSERYLLCNNCNRFQPIETMWADLNGPAFRAFYCGPCASEVRYRMREV
jgi:hypothetical protein